MAALRAWKQADLFLYAVPVLENYPQVWSHPKQSETGVAGYGLNWKRAFWPCFRENERFHAQNWVYKFGHCTYSRREGGMKGGGVGELESR